MRTELSEAELIDKYLLNQLDDAGKESFKFSMLINSTLAEKVEAQQQAHRFIRLFARRQQRMQLENIYNSLCREASFMQQLKKIFA